MRITVNICTWNRCELLRQVLESMCALSIPDGVEWELQVVNNACTDDTDKVLDEFKGRLPLQVLHEPVAGKSRALNLGLRSASGDLILFTDDDALVSSRWLSDYVAVAQQWPDAAFFGGPVDPWFSIEAPSWVVRHLDALQGPYAIRRSSSQTRRIERAQDNPFGVNMAIRRQVLGKDAFNVALGPMQLSEVRGEETALLAQLTAAGHYGVWIGTALVKHFIPPQRLSARYLYAYYRGQGVTQCRVAPVPTEGRVGIPVYAVKEAMLNGLALGLLWPLKSSMWLRALKRYGKACGVIRQSLDRKQTVAGSGSVAREGV